MRESVRVVRLLEIVAASPPTSPLLLGHRAPTTTTEPSVGDCELLATLRDPAVIFLPEGSHRVPYLDNQQASVLRAFLQLHAKT